MQMCFYAGVPLSGDDIVQNVMCFYARGAPQLTMMFSKCCNKVILPLLSSLQYSQMAIWLTGSVA